MLSNPDHRSRFLVVLIIAHFQPTALDVHAHAYRYSMHHACTCSEHMCCLCWVLAFCQLDWSACILRILVFGVWNCADGDRKCLVHAADRLDKNGQLRENMLMHIVPVEVERGLTLKERELLRMKEGEVNGDQPEPQAAAATQSASQIALIALMNAPAMDRKGVTSAKLAEFVVSYEKYMESVARRNMPGVLEVLAHEAAIRIDNEQILSKG